VTLWERRRLGGLLHEASRPEFKSDLRPYLDYLVTGVRKAGVRVVEAEASADDVRDFDVVVVATGAESRRLGDAELAVETEHADGDVLIVGGGWTGVETALVLSADGASSVTLVEAGAELMRGDVLTDRITYLPRLEEQGVRVLTDTRVDEVTDAGVQAGGEELHADRVLVAVGAEPRATFADELRQAGVEVHVIGDAVAPRRILDAVHEAYAVARSL
jgi:pyruvate/2-oxoglutarate dehydrogenase complex dihydrolipoamide dehydrogenase (E3) component